MKYYKGIILALITIIIIQGYFWFILYQRTKIANYDEHLAHYNMSDKYDYCPYCGLRLSESEE